MSCVVLKHIILYPNVLQISREWKIDNSSSLSGPIVPKLAIFDSEVLFSWIFSFYSKISSL